MTRAVEGKRVVVGMSGGVDSTVAALLLQQRGYEVIGLTMRMLANDSGDDPVARARAVAVRLGIRHETCDASQRFEERVLRSCWNEMERGATPNPCVLCNTHLKFGLMLNIARGLGAARIATGHYARLELNRLNQVMMRRGVDTEKDQSYFLHNIVPSALRHVLFPLGTLTKEQVGVIAEKHSLVPTSKYRESQDFCFAGSDEHVAEKLRQHFHGASRAGIFVDGCGRVLGQHHGIHSYTIGQRRGLGFATGQRMRIISIDHQSGVITVSGDPEDVDVKSCQATDFNWHRGSSPKGARVMAQVRYRQKPVEATITELSAHGEGVSIVFEKAVRGVTPGQSLVLYDGDLLLGGGRIQRAEQARQS